ncbi:unnamed protein product [Cuscuta campestris]|uniref:Sulfite exporter TauE/SafE family protein n=2 Tax=Cuscuta sect. Cleistogrammica TaxID=1824901 RepID=A0A484MGF4_9ASTE|nr:unnamed protein product [Cuscuta campestris]
MSPTTVFLAYLIVASTVAVLSVVYLQNLPTSGDVSSSIKLASQIPLRSETKVWPELRFSWRTVVATVIGFLGSACGTVGGVGGGGIFVPMLTLIVGFDTKSAAAVSKCMIMGASGASVWYNLRVGHPCRAAPIIDYDLTFLFQPMLMLGITIGVSLSVVFPYWLISVLTVILFIGTSSRSAFKGIEMWREESKVKESEAEQRQTLVSSHGELEVNTGYEPLVPKEERTGLKLMMFNMNVKKTMILFLTWISFLLLQVFKNNVVACSRLYWVFNLLQFPVALGLFGYECVKLYKESKSRRVTGNQDMICDAAIDWTVVNLALCALSGLVGGTVGGLLGSGGGFVLGPLLLEIGVIPQVASATATFVMMFSSSLSVVEFYLLKRFPIPFAMYLTGVSVLAGFWGQCLVRKIVGILRRASIIVFILSGVIFASALTMGVVGVEKSVSMIHNHEFMGFLDFCSSQ